MPETLLFTMTLVGGVIIGIALCVGAAYLCAVAMSDKYTTGEG